MADERTNLGLPPKVREDSISEQDILDRIFDNVIPNDIHIDAQGQCPTGEALLSSVGIRTTLLMESGFMRRSPLVRSLLSNLPFDTCICSSTAIS